MDAISPGATGSGWNKTMLAKLSIPAALLLLMSAVAISPTASATCTVMVLATCGNGPCDPILAVGCGTNDCVIVAASACPPSNLGTNHCNNTDPDDIILFAGPGLVIGVDTGANGQRVLCINNTDVWVGAAPYPGVPLSQVVQVRLCNGLTCQMVLDVTGAGVGPGGPGLTCTLGQCVYVWVNGVQVVP